MGRQSYYYWADRDVTTWAKAYTKKGETLESLELSLGVSHSTLWWCFQHRLGNINEKLYLKTLKKLDFNRRKGGRKNGR